MEALLANEAAAAATEAATEAGVEATDVDTGAMAGVTAGIVTVVMAEDTTCDSGVPMALVATFGIMTSGDEPGATAATATGVVCNGITD